MSLKWALKVRICYLWQCDTNTLSTQNRTLNNNFFFIVLVSTENVIFQWVYKPCFGFIPFFLASLRCVRLLASNVTTSVASNMHSLMPYHIEIQAAGLHWNNSIDISIQGQHHTTKDMFISCVYPQLYTPQFLHHHAKSKCTTILSDLHRNFHLVFSFLYLRASFRFLSQALLSPSVLRPQTKIGPRTS